MKTEAGMKTMAVALMVLGIAATNARAQISGQLPPMATPVYPTQSVFGADPIMRITVAFRTAAATPETPPMSDAKAAETVRRTLYGMAAGECAVLSEIFKAECVV